MFVKHTMPFRGIRPFVRHVQRLYIRPGEYPVFRRSYDCRLFYVYRGSGTIYIEQRAHPVSQGDMALWQPNTDYRMEPKNDIMQFLCVNFDYTDNHRALDFPIPPDLSDAFDPTRATELIAFSDMEPLGSPVFLRNLSIIEGDLLEMKREYQARRIFWRERLSGLTISLMGQIARRLSLSASETLAEDARMDQVIEYIQAHFAEPLTNALLGHRFSYHPNYLNKQMLSHTGQTLHQYILTCRISYAIELLETTDLTITEIAEQTGSGSISHFSKLFKQKTGNNPSDYRRTRT